MLTMLLVRKLYCFIDIHLVIFFSLFFFFSFSKFCVFFFFPILFLFWRGVPPPCPYGCRCTCLLPRYADVRNVDDSSHSQRYPGYESRKPVNLHSDRVESFQFTNSTVFVFAAVAGTRPAAELTPPYYCSICEIDTLSPKNLAGHKTGKKHKLFAAIAGRWKTALEAMATEDLITAGGACGGGNSGP